MLGCPGKIGSGQVRISLNFVVYVMKSPPLREIIITRQEDLDLGYVLGVMLVKGI